MDISAVTSALSGLATGPVGPVASATAEALKIWNHYLQIDPVKDAKERRELLRKFKTKMKEVYLASPGQDVSNLIVDILAIV